MFGNLRVFLDGREMDCADVGNLEVFVGTYLPTQRGAPHTATITLNKTWDEIVPASSPTAYWADALSLVVFAEFPTQPSYTAPWDAYVSGGNYIWPVFNGLVIGRDGLGPQLVDNNQIVLNFQADYSLLWQQTSRLAAKTDQGLRGLLADMCTAEGFDATGTVAFPDNTGAGIFDQPYQARAGNGGFIQVPADTWACYPLGSWQYAPNYDLDCRNHWRPSRYTANGNVDKYSQTVFSSVQEYAYAYGRAGMSFDEAYSKVVVSSNGNGNQDFTGSASTSLSWPAFKKTLRVLSWNKSNADCATMAGRIRDQVNGGEFNHIGSTIVNLDGFIQTLTNDGYVPFSPGLSAKCLAIDIALGKVGDEKRWGLHPATIQYWPSYAQPLAGQLRQLVRFNTLSEYRTRITGVRHTWHPSNGWTVETQHYSLAGQ
jgi:hypothetical protein